MNAREFLLELFVAGLAAADPLRCVPPHLPPPPKGRTVVVGAGKAAAAMAKAVEDHWERPLEGLVVTRYGHSVACQQIEVVEAAHPIPDVAGAAATQRILARLRGLTPDDLVLFLGSGGGSALLVAPAPPISLQDKQAVTAALLKSGAAISEINAVRKHLSAVKGGRLAAAAAPATVVGLLISDVAGDNPATIMSGPTVPDPTTRQEARAILDRHGIAVSAAMEHWLADPASETSKPGHYDFLRVRNVVIATAKDALAAAARAAESAGVDAVIIDDAVTGEAREVAKTHARLALDRAQSGLRRPCVLLSGGEVTVAVKGTGRGGPNAEYLLALGIELGSRPSVSAIACDTDGIDGSEDNAGAILTPDALARAETMDLDAAGALAQNDSYRFFGELGLLVRMGPTRTNVSDFRAILIVP